MASEDEVKKDLEKDLNIVTSCFLGSNFEKPKILSSLNETFVPEKSIIFKFPGESKITSETQSYLFDLDLNSAQLPDFQCLELIYIAFEFPDLVACSASAQAGYCDLPALNVFQNFKLSIANQVTETLTPISLNLALKDHFKENYNYWANKWLGGLNGPNQKLSKCEFYRNGPSIKEASQNIIKNKFKCLVPLKFHIFRNKNLKNLLTSQKINISFTLSSYADCIMHNKSYVPIQHLFNIEFYGQAITSDETVFNNMSHTIPSEAYLELDEYYETTQNKILATPSDFKFNLNTNPTTQYFAQLSPANFSKKNLYLGETTEKAIKNYWASMFKIKTPTADIDSLIELNKQEFTSSNLKKNNKKTQYSIRKIDPKSFAIVFSTDSRQDPYEILISFSIELNLFPEDFCLDLFHYTTPSPFFLKPEYFSSVHFEFEKFNEYNHLHNEDINTFTLNIIDVPSYYFSFQAKDNQKYVFKEVNSIQKSFTVTQDLIDIAASMPTTICETRVPFSPVAAKSFIYLKKPNWPYYDLSGKIPIEVIEYKIDSDITCNLTLELEKQIKDCFDISSQEFQLSKRFSYRTVKNQTYGFVIPKQTPIEFKFKEFDFTLEKAKDEQVYDLTNFMVLNLIQANLKHFKYINNTIKYFKHSDYSVMATEVLTEDIGENGRFSDFHVFKEQEEEDNSDLISITKKKRKIFDEFPTKIKNIRSNAINSPGTNSQIATFNRRR